MNKQAYYFAHDSNARNDIKMIRLRRQLGLEGYGAFWCIIEMLRESSDYKLPISALDDIAFDINISREKLDTIVNSYDLFILEENSFFSARLMRSMEMYDSQKVRLSEGGKRAMEKRWNGSKKSGNKDNNSFI